MADQISTYAADNGLGVALLGADVIYAKWLFDPMGREDIRLSRDATLEEPAILVDWGRALVVQSSNSLRVNDLKGSVFGEIDRPADLDGGVLDKSAMRLLFWGRRRGRTEYGVYLGDLRANSITTLRDWDANAIPANPGIAASFADRDPTLVRISCGFESYKVRAAGGRLEPDNWQLEWADLSLDGRFAAGRRSDGKLVVLEPASSRTWEPGILVLGRTRWDPSSRYLLAVRPTPQMPWHPQTEIVIVDAERRTSLAVPAIVPDERYHPYEWILRA